MLVVTSNRVYAPFHLKSIGAVSIFVAASTQNIDPRRFPEIPSGHALRSKVFQMQTCSMDAAIAQSAAITMAEQRSGRIVRREGRRDAVRRHP